MLQNADAKFATGLYDKLEWKKIIMHNFMFYLQVFLNTVFMS
jgi:hypothetical protein